MVREGSQFKRCRRLFLFLSSQTIKRRMLTANQNECGNLGEEGFGRNEALQDRISSM